MLSGEDHLLSPTLVMPSTSAPALPECHISTSNPLWMKPKFSSFIPESLFCFKLIGVPWGNIFCLSLTFLHAFLKKTHLFYLLNCKSSREKSSAFFVFVSAATSNAIIIWELQMNKWSEVRSTAYLVFFFFALQWSLSDQSPNTWLEVLLGMTAQWSLPFISPGSSQNTAMCHRVLFPKQVQNAIPGERLRKENCP